MFQFTAIKAPQKLNKKLAIYILHKILYTVARVFYSFFVSPTLALISSTKTKKPWIGNWDKFYIMQCIPSPGFSN